MPALASTAAHTSQVLRPELPYLILFKEKKHSEAIARCRVIAVANQVAHALREVDHLGEYKVIMSRNKQFEWALIDLRMQPNMIVVEAIGRTEIAIAYRELITIDPTNTTRYSMCRCSSIDIQEAQPQ